MICPVCGNTLKENQMICDHCGANIKELQRTSELKKQKSVSSMKQGLDLEDELLDEYPGKAKKKAGQEKKQKNVSKKSTDKSHSSAIDPKKNRKKVILVIVITVVAVLAAVLITFFVRKHIMDNKYDKYMKEGKGYYQQEDYTNARTRFIEAARNATSNSQKSEVYSLLYRIDEILTADYREKIDFLEILVDLNKNETQYYKDLIVLYQNHDMDAQIDALKASAPDSVKSELENYVGTIPKADPDAGTYNNVMKVSLKADNDVTIYYTTDGSDVTDSNSKKEYSAPIRLKDEGTFTIRTYSIDSYGVSSKEAVYTYTISFVHVDAPVVSLESGSYKEAKKIEVTADNDCSIYYTTDGSTPTKSSEKYSEPLDLEKGNLMYQFVAINKDGISSDVVTKIYDYSPTYQCSYASALSKLRGYFPGIDEYNEYEDGKIAVFTYNEIAEIDEQDYYIISYSLDDGSDSRKYAVSCDTGTCYKVSGSGDDYQLDSME